MRFLRTHLKQLFIGLGISFFIMLLGLYGYVFWDLPSISQIDAGLALPSTRIYDRHGALLYEILPPRTRAKSGD